MEQNNYVNYQGMLSSITTGISRLDGVCRHLSMEAQADELAKIGDRLKNHVFSVGIMGEFKRGKSTVINALLGQKVVPADVVPCSATLNYVRWDISKHAEIHFKDGSTAQVSVDELSNYVTKLTQQSAETAESVEEAVVYFPCTFCQNGVQIVDTPGLNDDERMTAVSERVLPTLDAIIMVVTADSPFSQSEAEFVRNKVMSSDLGRIIFLVNKIDYVDEEDRPRLLRTIKEKIRSSVLEKMAAVYGKDSEEYKNAADKIGNIRILPVSARDALRGRIKNNKTLFEESGYIEFEKSLSRLLTEERGMLELIHPVNQILSSGKEALQTIETRLNALAMSAGEFEQVQNDSIKKITDAREKKKEEIRSLRAKGRTLYADLMPELGTVYDDLEAALTDYAYSCEISESDVASDSAINAFSDKITNEINHEMDNQLSIQTERLQARIQEQLGRDVESMEQFAKEIVAQMQEIHLSMRSSSSEEGSKSILGGALVEGVGNYALANLAGGVLPGIGGLISGFREHGIKGAMVGGAAGLGITLATTFLLAPLGIVGLPLALITGVASSFGGKKIAQLLFGKRSRPAPTQPSSEEIIAKVRDNLADSVSKSMNDLRKSLTLENWLKEYCENIYDKVAGNIDQEWENSLQTMEETLSQIKLDLEMNAENRRKIESDMREYADSINDVFEVIQPIYNRLTAALN